jgi:hypothetical protein
MKNQHASRLRIQFLNLIVVGVTTAGLSAAAAAAGLEAGIDTHAGATLPGTSRAGGSADVHMSPSGSANSNAQWTDSATRGTDRAAERANAQGTEMGTAGSAHVKGKP